MINRPAAPGGDQYITAATLEDEVKRVKLRFDGRITSPGAFNGGGYRDARVDLTILASLFAVINDLPGDVRWKAEAPAARDLIARTARNAAAGSTQVFNEAKLRKADLQDLVSGLAIQGPPDVEPVNDWTMIADRVPLMQYAQELTDRLDDLTRSEEEATENADAIRRQGELLAAHRLDDHPRRHGRGRRRGLRVVGRRDDARGPVGGSCR